MEKRLMTLLVGLFLLVGGVIAQTKVNGTVVSQEDGQPVIGASVMVVGTNVGTVTNANGQFSLTCPAGKSMLRISYVGMEPLEVSARPNMRILLTSDSKALDEVIVVAFGTAKKSAFTGSAKVVGSEDLSMSQVTSVTDALAGAVPGIQIVSASGDPSSTGTIRIRGFSSLNAGKDPLIVVDGAPYSGDMANLNPADIESMTVLKDAASNALYGARGANGVIMITTKRAKMGQDATVTFDAKWGANTRALQHYETVNSPEKYYEMQYGALRDYYLLNGYNSVEAWRYANENLTGPAANGGVGYNIWTLPEGQYIIGQDGKLNPNATLGRLVSFKGEDYWVTPDDWEKEGTRTGLRQEYNVTVSGANEKSSFYSSLGYLGNEGITDKSDMKRLTARLRADYQAKKWLKVGSNMAYTRFDHNSLGNNGTSTSTGNIWAFTSQIAPIYPIWVRNADGSIKVDGNGIKMMDYGTGPTTTKADPGITRPFIGDANPVQDVRLNTRNFEGNAFNGTAFADFTIFDGLVFTVNGTVNLDETRGTYVYNPYYGQFDTTGGTVSKYHQRRYDYNLQQLLNFNRTFGGMHNVGVMLGHEYTDDRTYYLYADKSKMFSQENKELGGAVVDGQSAYSYKSRYNNEGWFGRLQYDYNTKYFASASLRRDASSRFDPEYKWGTFWSAGAAWLINKEEWFNIDWVDELKLKVSYGSQGNDNIDAYLYTDLFNIANSSGNIGTFFQNKGTKDITWETNSNLNLGFEFQLFKKLTGSVDFYYRKTTDMLYQFSVAPSLGYTNYWDNVGDLYNTGVEIDLTYNILHNKNINWDVNLNFASLKNRLTKLHEDNKVSTVYGTDGKKYNGYNDGNFYVAEDLSIYSWYIKDYAGVNEQGQAMWYKNTFDDAGNWTGRETTTTYSEADYYVTEETTVPKFYGGFGTSVKAYGFDFTINCSYQIGGKQYDGTYAAFMTSPSASHAGYHYHQDLFDAWTTQNQNSDIPRFIFATGTDQYATSYSTRFLTDASYLNIENINLGYTLPKTFTRKFMVEGIRVYASAENVFYWSKRKGFDPRQSFSATTNATRYSPMRTISGGITLTF